MALTAAQYKAEEDAALSKYGSSVGTSVERAMLWAQISSVYAHLYTHQKLFDSKAVVGSATAQAYRTKAESYLNNAKTWTASTAATPRGIAACQAASVSAYTYCQIVKIESDKV